MLVNIVVLFIAFLIGLMSIGGIHSKIMRMHVFYFFPPSRFLANALHGLEKLKALGEKVVDKQGNLVQNQKQGVMQAGDKGFKEIVEIIKNIYSLEGDFQEIILVEDDAGVLIGNSPSRIRFIELRTGTEELTLKYNPFDPDECTRKISNIIDDKFREKLAYWTMGLLALWLLFNSYLLYSLNQ